MNSLSTYTVAGLALIATMYASETFAGADGALDNPCRKFPHPNETCDEMQNGPDQCVDIGWERYAQEVNKKTPLGYSYFVWCDAQCQAHFKASQTRIPYSLKAISTATTECNKVTQEDFLSHTAK